VTTSPPRILFVTGRFAEPALRQVVPPLAEQLGFTCDIVVLPITVAALMHVEWVQRKLTVPAGVSRVILPGWCQGDLSILSNQWQVPFERGPKDVFDLPEYLGRPDASPPKLDDYSIEIIAEINHAPRLTLDELLWQADVLRQSGANIIDLGCIPGEVWTTIGDTVRKLVAAGFRMSVDSFNEREVTDAVASGAELVLSCNSSNFAWAQHVPAEFVVIPDSPPDAQSLDDNAAAMLAAGQKVRLDPILEPVGFGFATSLARYFAVRQRHPDAALLMGIGNVTELSEVDSAGLNFVLAAICEELRIGSVLTTQVINWCRSAVAEFDAARRLVRYSLAQRRLPKHLDGRLLLLRDPKLHELGDEGLRQLAARITDPNFRIFAERGEVHLLNRDGYWHGSDPYEVFDRMVAAVGTLTGEHAFYLGMELMKARTALTLGKQYTQDEALRWGFLTVDEISAVERRHRAAAPERS
jgi:dihydropteroate synthase-like protein